MTRKHYTMLARAMHREYAGAQNESERQGMLRVALSVASALHQDNPQFDRDRFMRAVREGV